MSERSNKTLLEWFKQEISEHKKKYVNKMISGEIENFNDYRYNVGIIEGLDQSYYLVIHLLEQVLHEKDDTVESVKID